MAPFVVLDALQQALLDEVEALPAMCEVLPELPADLLLSPSSGEPFGCDCDCACEPLEEPVRWAVPGVWDDEPAAPVLPPVGGLVARVQDAIGAVARVAPVSLDPAVALVEVQALQAAVQGLRVLLLGRVADVTDRQLFELGGFHSTGGWLAAVAPDAVPADRSLAGRLGALPVLGAAVLDGRVALRNAQHVGTAMGQVGRFEPPRRVWRLRFWCQPVSASRFLAA